jgi:hypothetical protein
MNKTQPNDDMPLSCHRCGAELQPGQGDFFLVRIEAMADPFPPVFTEQDRYRDSAAEIRRLLDEMRDLSAREAMDQVYRRLVIYLCNPCYRRWIKDPVK